MTNPISLYIHTPWCIRKCPYCDFNSHTHQGPLPEIAYIQALIADLTADLERFPARPVQSIFIGGGTPSLFAAASYDLLFNALNRLLPFMPHIEITLEANPGATEQQRFRDYRALGINRLSLGIQSFNPLHLKALGRVHDDTQARRAITEARAAGFENINLDLMYGLPAQSIAEGLQDLREALAFDTEHLSWYELTLEPNTVFYKQQPRLPDEDHLLDLEEEGLALLATHHFQRYEISAFSKFDRRCQHNMNYWRFGDYYGIGAGAHGKYTLTDDAQHREVFRSRKHRQPTSYLKATESRVAECMVVGSADLIFEFMLNVTRLEGPIEIGLLTTQTGLDGQCLRPLLIEAARKELIILTDTCFEVTSFGRRHTNALQAMFLP
jgi:putative oxygen-independent coproporphyrinogen III oxidase